MFKVGDEVIVVKADPDCWYSVGEVYEVSGVNDYPFTTEEEHVTVVGVARTAYILMCDIKLHNGGQQDWTDKHYDFFYKLTPQDIERGEVKIDAYRVSKQWGLGTKDESGVLFHIVKTCARFGDKNTREREIKALYAQIKCLAEIEGVEL